MPLPWLLLALSCDPKGPGAPGPDGGSADGGTTDGGATDGGGTDDTGASADLTLRISTTDGATGPVLLRLAPADGGEALQVEAELTGGEVLVTVPGLSAGAWGLRACLDEDGDGAWGGAWLAAPEPSALHGLRLPRGELALRLRRGVPTPILDEAPELVSLYERAWALAAAHIQAGTTDNGFADHYMDEAFSAQVFQWDTCFLALIGMQGVDAFPAMEGLDNFYGTQREDGWICRVVDEDDGSAGGTPDEPSEPMINPPLFGLAELRWARRTGDLSRLPRVLPVLHAYHDWIDAHVRTGAGLYYTSMLGSGMDNAPREAAYDGWVDISAQQALGRRVLGELHDLAGDGEGEAQRAAAEELCADIRERMWSEAEGWFMDLGPHGALLDQKTLAGAWPLLAGCASAEQAAAAVATLSDPAAFWRMHLFPSTAADEASYDPAGHYWRGGVWAPTTWATIQALHEVGRPDLARRAAENHLRNLALVHDRFTPAEGQLAADHDGDGTETLWELYAPDAVAPGTRWDATWLGRQDFVGWTGLGPTALLVEELVGLRADGPADTLTWTVSRTDRHGVQGFRFGDQLVDLVAAARDGLDQPVTVQLDSSDAFTLRLRVGGVTRDLAVPAGASTWTVDPAASALPQPSTPTGPFPGTSVVGNGRLAAVLTWADGSSDPPGIRHLYLGDHGTDLVEVGQTLVGQGGARVSGWTVGTDPSFAPFAAMTLPDGATLAWRSFVGEADAVVTVGHLAGGAAGSSATVAPLVQLREALDLDGALALDALGQQGEVLWARLSDGRALALALSPAPTAWQVGTITADPVAGGLSDSLGEGRQLSLSTELVAAPGEEAAFRQVLALGDSVDEAVATANRLLADADPLADAAAFHAAISPELLCDDLDLDGTRCRLAAANLAAARASVLDGAVPADLTGQFETHGFPQLYPRDALMVARALLTVGLADEAAAIVEAWLDPDLDRPRPGEWYARYDARYRGVDAGTGAAFDEPEWDANGYLALVVRDLARAGWSPSADAREVLLQGLDFLVEQQDADGLWTEGGIVEWSGRLPATTMTNHEGLLAGASLAEAWGQPERAADYRAAAGAARWGLLRLLEPDGVYLADERGGALTWNSSLLFGPVLGYPLDPVLQATLAFHLEQTTALGFGVRYFEDPAATAGGYGADLFFFTTAAAARAALDAGDPATAAALVDWMAAFPNAYGLAPERVYADGGGASVASPLSWCAAELALAALALGRDGGRGIDGEIGAAEYLSDGAAVVDHEGDPDLSGDPVALYAAAAGETLHLGLRTSGPPEGTYRVYLSGADGAGSLAGEDGWLGFRVEEGVEPGAVAVLELGEGCEVEGLACLDFAAGAEGLEATVDLGALGLTAPVQLIAARDGDLVPDSGSLSTAGAGDTVLLTFELSTEALSLGDGERVCLSGDRPELGAWEGCALSLDGVDPATLTVQVERGGSVAYKYLVGVPGSGDWSGVEFDGEDRVAWVQDADGTGRVVVRDVFGQRGGELVDP